MRRSLVLALFVMGFGLIGQTDLGQPWSPTAVISAATPNSVQNASGRSLASVNESLRNADSQIGIGELEIAAAASAVEQAEQQIKEAIPEMISASVAVADAEQQIRTGESRIADGDALIEQMDRQLKQLSRELQGLND